LETHFSIISYTNRNHTNLLEEKIMKKRPIVYLITAALLTLTVSGCGSEKTEKQTKQPTEKEPTKVILNEVAHSIFYAPMYAAIENGYFEDEGLDITVITGFGVTYLVQNKFKLR
jgi:ABC-type nitrate/sulfonate/bicarbonate transport system substrate-binding protein